MPPTQTWLHALVTTLPEDVFSTVLTERTEHRDQFPGQVPIIVRPRRWPGRTGRILDRLGFANGNAGLEDQIRVDRPDLVHAHFGNHAWRALRACRARRVPLIASFYGMDVDRVPRSAPRWRARYLDLFEGAARILVLGPSMLSRLQDLGCPADRLVLQHLGVNVERIPFAPRRRDPDEPIRILIAAAFREKKGIPDAIRAIARLKDRHDVLITIVGDATADPETETERARIHAAIDDGNVRSLTRFAGMLPHAKLLAEAAEHDVFLAPSRTAANGDSEGTPMTLVEMAAAGLAIVSTRHSDIPEIIVDGESGLLAEEGDIDGIAECIELIALDPERRMSMCLAARRRVELEFDIGIQAGRLAALYRDVGGR